MVSRFLLVCSVILCSPVLCRAATCKYEVGDIGSLRRALGDPSCDVFSRSEVVDAISTLGPEAVSAVPELLVAIDAKHPRRCNHFECVGTDLVVPILRALKAIGPDAALLSVPRLARLLTEKPNQYPTEYVFEALISFGPRALPVLPVVIGYLTKQPANSGYRSRAVALVAAIGPGAIAAKPVLWEIARRKGDTERANAAAALIGIDASDDQVFNFLIERFGEDGSNFLDVLRTELDRRIAAGTVPISSLFPLRDALMKDHYNFEERLLAAIATLGKEASPIQRDVLKKGAAKAGNVAAAAPYFRTLEAMNEVPESDIALLCPYIDTSYKENVTAAIGLLKKPISPPAQKALVCCNVHSVWAAPTLFPANGEEIFEAAKDGDLEALTSALQAVEGSSFRASNGETLLNWLVSSGRADLVKVALERKVEVNAFGPKGKTALMKAVEVSGNNKAIIGMLLAAGADRSARDCDGKTALDYAASMGKTELISALETADGSGAASLRSYSDLVQAIGEGESDRLKIAALEDLDRHPEGLLPLVFVALEKKRFAIVKLLIERGAKLDGRDGRGEPLLPSLIFKEAPVDVIAAALQSGVNPATISKNGWPALNIAASQGNADVVQLLIQWKADLNLLDSANHTAIGEALIRGHYDVARSLREAGAKPVELDLTEAGQYAASKLSSRSEVSAKGHEELLYLLVLGLDPKEYVGGGWALLHHAIWAGDIKMVRELLGRGADPKAKLGDGRTPQELLAAGRLETEKHRVIEKLLNQ